MWCYVVFKCDFVFSPTELTLIGTRYNTAGRLRWATTTVKRFGSSCAPRAKFVPSAFNFRNVWRHSPFVHVCAQIKAQKLFSASMDRALNKSFNLCGEDDRERHCIGLTKCSEILCARWVGGFIVIIQPREWTIVDLCCDHLDIAEEWVN